MIFNKLLDLDLTEINLKAEFQLKQIQIQSEIPKKQNLFQMK
jgi:hypothetical protein